jgi:uncharacterized membrane protein YjjP (DUF1212 family)
VCLLYAPGVPPTTPSLGERFVAEARRETAGATAAPIASPDDPAELVMQLGRALHGAGSPSHRIEEGMDLAARRLGIVGQFFSTPTALFASFTDAAGRRTILERVQPGDMNLERMSDLVSLLADLANGEVTPRQASARLAAIAAAPTRYGPLITTVSFALASGAAALFLGGSEREIAAAAALGLGIGGLATLAGRLAPVARLFEPLAALLASLAATLIAFAWPPLSVYLVTLAGLIVLVPGLTLTVAINELASRQLVSGSARFAGAVALFFVIALGVAVGSQLGAVLTGGAGRDVTPVPVDDGWRWAALVAAGLAFTVLLRARPAQAGWLILAGVLAIEGVRLGGWLLGPQLAGFVGAFLVGLAGNVYARLRPAPAALLQVPGLILLVPGSIGFRSLSALLAEDVLSGVHAAFTATLVAIALATGILLANVVLPPRRVL